MAEKKVNYTDAEVNEIVEMYDGGKGMSVEAIAETKNRAVRSIRAKLVGEGVYVKQEKPKAAAKREGPTKGEMLTELDAYVTFNTDGLMGATKAAISEVIALAKAVYVEPETLELTDEQRADADEGDAETA